MIGDKIERICDSCAAIILPPDLSPNSYPGLRKFSESHNFEKFNPKLAAFSFISSLLSDSKESSHTYAINTLLKLYKSHAPEMIQSRVPYNLLHHSVNCKCQALSSSLDLFVSLYMADPSGCEIDFSSPPFDNIDINKFFAYESIEMKRAAARFLYLLVSEGHIHVSNVSNLVELIHCPDKWVTAFIVASIAFKIPRCELEEIFTREIKGTNILQNFPELTKGLVKLFNKSASNSSAAARYYAAVTLDYLCHFDDCLQTLAALDCTDIVTNLAQCFPKDSSDDRSEIKTAIYLTSVEYQIWKAAFEGKLDSEKVKNQFSVILLPLFDIIGIENKNVEKCLLSSLQVKFLEIMRFISKEKEMKAAINSQQMQQILTNLGENQSQVGEEAKKTLAALQSE